MPTLTVLAGPNGSGKSTLTARLNLGPREYLVDPDAIARELDPADPSRAALSAGRETIRRCREFVETGASFVLETTLAGNSALSVMENAKAAKYHVRLLYIALSDPALNIRRVRARFVMGGHDVPDEDILRRYERSQRNFASAVRLADESAVFDNSGEQIRPIAELAGIEVIWKAAVLPAWAEKILLDLR